MADILVVDDDPDVAEALGEIMRSEGHRARVAFDGEDGLREALARMPDLLLLDVDMPRLDGPGMAYALLVQNTGLEKVPIVLVSGVPDLREVARRVGTEYFLAKPFAYERLLSMVERALCERAPPRPPATTDATATSARR